MLKTIDSPSQRLSQLCESSRQTPENEFLQTIARNTIAGLKDCREVNLIIYFKFLILVDLTHIYILLKQVNTFIVLATIKYAV